MTNSSHKNQLPTEETVKMDADALAGLQVLCGRYRQRKRLGRGRFGEVWLCDDEISSIQVAIKMLPAHLAEDTRLVEEILANFRRIHRLHHPNICAVKTVDRDDRTGNHYLVMDYEEGKDLETLRRDRGGVLPVEEALAIARQVAEALDYCHARKIIHRDIKPSNIYVTSEGTVRILDFGLAMAFQTTVSMEDLAGEEESKVGGTPYFMPPEQWEGARQGGHSDQYALAATVYNLLCGKYPYKEAPSLAAVREAALHTPLPRDKMIGAALWPVLQKALAKKPSRRFSSCTAFVEALENARQGKRRTSFPGGISLPAAGASVLVMLLLLGVLLHGARLAEPATSPADVSTGVVPVDASALRYRALIIGVNAYQDGWSPLKNAVNDGKAVATVLREQYGFDVTLLLDEEATLSRITAELEKFLNLNLQDMGLIYFAGHGSYFPDLNEGYWIPADASHPSRDPGAATGWLWNTMVSRFLEASDARHILVVADSCYAGALFRGAAVGNGSKAHLFSRLFNAPSRYVIASGAASETVFDSGRENSPFARYLLDFLRSNTNQLVSASEVAEGIRDRYETHTGNSLQFGPLLRPGKGEFVFMRGAEGIDPEALDLLPEPESFLSHRSLEGVITLAEAGHDSMAARLLAKAQAGSTTGGLAQAVASYYDAGERQSRARRVDELVTYIRERSGPPAPEVEEALREFAQPRVMAVLGPRDRDAAVLDHSAALLWRIGIADALRNAGAVRVVDRNNLEEMLSELKLSGTELSDDRARLLIGTLLPASYLVTGDRVQEGKAEHVFLRLLATDTGEVLGAFEARVGPGENAAAAMERLGREVVARAVQARPLLARISPAEGNVPRAAAGRFHGVNTNSHFDLVQRVRQADVIFEEYRERLLGTATVAYLGENTSDLDPAWAGGAAPDSFDDLWARERTAAAGDDHAGNDPQ